MFVLIMLLLNEIAIIFTAKYEETDALIDLVENGANLLKSVACLLKDTETLNELSSELISLLGI